MEIDELDVEANTVAEVGGLKFVNATGEEMTPAMVDMFVAALVESGQLVRDAEGNLSPPTTLEEGKMIGVEFNVKDGEITHAQQIPDDEIPVELRRQ